MVFNPLNIAREDLVEASMNFPRACRKPSRYRSGWQGSPGADFERQESSFLANVPSVGYAVYDVQPGAARRDRSTLKVSENSLENQYYRVKLNADGDVASIFDKSIGKELLSAPARLAISTTIPSTGPPGTWTGIRNRLAPKHTSRGPAQIRVVENGPARVAIEVSRETAGSRFVQTISLSAGDAGKRVEFANVIDWNTKESNLKATFPLTASNQLATYNWDIGTIERPTARAEEIRSAVPSVDRSHRHER